MALNPPTQYADDRNLAARQRLWAISAIEPDVDVNDWALDLADPAAAGLVLDAGCGNGKALALLRDRGARAVGADLSPGMAATSGHPLVAVGDVQALPFADAAFGVALAFMMLYHVPCRTSAAAELRRVLRPGGRLVATTASDGNQAELKALVEEAVGGGWSWHRPSSQAFSLENGAEQLAAAFDHVERVDMPVRTVLVRDADAMADYVGSTRDHYEPTLPPGRAWDDVVEEVRARTRTAVERDGAFRTTARLGAFVCR